jgi:hypothetical protein
MQKVYQMSVILESTIDGDLQPLTRCGVTMYPASALERIFDWANRIGHEIEWIEGVFFDPVAQAEQLSVAYICERSTDTDSRVFRAACLEIAAAMMEEARSESLVPYVEIGISN